MVEVNTKYMNADKKVKHLVIPLREGSWEILKEVVANPSLRD